MISLRSVSFGYSKRKNVLNDISFDIGGGKIIALLGKNGSGKSTLLSCLGQEIVSYSGEIVLDDGASLKRLSPKQRARIITYVPQTSFAQGLSVYDTVMLGRIPFYAFAPTKNDHQVVMDTLSELSLQEVAFSSLGSISGGERQKALLGVALAADSQLLLLDEPTNNLDVIAKANLFNIIAKRVKSSQKSILFSTHDISLAYEFADEALLLYPDGTLHCGGKEMLDEEHLSRAYGEEIQLLTHEGHAFISYRKEN